eukprot:1024316-Pyramimonas_sp.AAC.1
MRRCGRLGYGGTSANVMRCPVFVAMCLIALRARNNSCMSGVSHPLGARLHPELRATSSITPSSHPLLQFIISPCYRQCFRADGSAVVSFPRVLLVVRLDSRTVARDLKT